MTDIVIPLIRTSYDNHLELKYALRSMQANLIEVGKLILVGHRPNWCRPDVFVPYKDAKSLQDKERNIADKLLASILCVSDTFLYCNDDHFITSKYNIDEFPNYYSLRFTGTGNYGQTISNTWELLGTRLNYDIHCPILINGPRFIERMNQQWPPWGYCMKTLYAHNLPGEVCEDRKIRTSKEDITGLPWFSTSDGILKGKLLMQVHQLWPHKSKWEI